MRLGKLNLPSLSIDELWALHEEVGATLSKKIASEKRELEERLAKLNRGLIGKLAIKRAALQIGDAEFAAHILQSCQNFKTRPIQRKPGRVVASSRAGWWLSSRLEGRQAIF